MDHESFDVRGQWEIDRGPQQLAYDVWWHLGYDTMVTSEWGTPDTFENGLNPEVLLGSNYGRHLHFWDLNRRNHLQEIDFGPEYQLVFELRPAHDPRQAYGFVNAWSASRTSPPRSGPGTARTAAGRCARSSTSRPSLPIRACFPTSSRASGAVPPLVTDIDLSMDDRFLYVSCWGTGDFQQYDVSDPFKPELTGKVRIGGIVSRAPPSRRRRKAAATAGRRWSRSAATASASTSPTRSMAPSTRSSITEGLDGWMVKLDADPDGGIAFDPDFFIDWPGPHRPHQVRLEGGDCSSDSYCYP